MGGGKTHANCRDVIYGRPQRGVLLKRMVKFNSAIISTLSKPYMEGDRGQFHQPFLH
jgi:hypothetical protein